MKLALIEQLRKDLLRTVLIKAVFQTLGSEMGDLSQIIHKGSEHICLGIDHFQIGIRRLCRNNLVQQTFCITPD